MVLRNFSNVALSRVPSPSRLQVYLIRQCKHEVPYSNIYTHNRVIHLEDP